jgi:hypothetical protein
MTALVGMPTNIRAGFKDLDNDGEIIVWRGVGVDFVDDVSARRQRLPIRIAVLGAEHNCKPFGRNIYIKTPSHVMANHQCNVRFATKLRFMLAVASLITQATGARDIPAVRDTLGRLAAMEAGYHHDRSLD